MSYFQLSDCENPRTVGGCCCRQNSKLGLTIEQAPFRLNNLIDHEVESPSIW